ncbi:PhzF family phenazine biosynthesis protein [Curvivirga aplysinae]|uniref:PhzF family phenazine biosynthesis protein n=1 Tax=Curvivirga aplysinae TaxID=2529852 RepID=UPI0012BC25BD|nr:PhzF family phenazine biosynthesis protein [Curvivirga aplysinae]MTI10002.1 PhzF family phenazine biosynthesis protein [Curvivirga aplysinae]
MQVEVSIVNAFVDKEKGGNPAGIVLQADQFSQSEKQEIAAKAALSETAFVSNSDTDTFKLEFFTPSRQIAHCGHATIATFNHLLDQKLIGDGLASKETIDGSRKILIKDSVVYMEQLAPTYTDITHLKDRVLASLGLSKDDLCFEPLLVNTGNNFVVVGVKDTSILEAIEPRQDLIGDISEELDLIGYYVFTQTTVGSDRDATTRMFAPRFAIPEEAATGMAAGPLACVLHDKLNIRKDKMLIEQGAYMKPASPSLITVTLDVDGDNIVSLMAGGKAKKMEDILVNLK